MNPRAAGLWTNTSLYLWPEELVLASFPVSALPELARVASPFLGGFSALVVERDEISLTIAQDAWPEIARTVVAHAVAGPFRAITFDIAIDLDVCGYLLPAAERLAAEGISIVPQCAFQKDHLLVHSNRADDAMRVLAGLIADARQADGANRCPICGADREFNERYPRLVCHDCSLRASDAAGRRLAFSNESLSGGLVATYADTNEPYDGTTCYVDGVECRADESRFGGYVIETVPVRK